MLSWPELVCPEQIGGTPQKPVLLGNRCRNCGEPFFPAAEGCTRCAHDELEPFELGGEGVLWSWTTQIFQPKPPYDGAGGADAFIPYSIGYVELPGGLKVESRLIGLPPFSIGVPMRLVLESYRVTDDRGGVHTFAFEAMT